MARPPNTAAACNGTEVPAVWIAPNSEPAVISGETRPLALLYPVFGSKGFNWSVYREMPPFKPALCTLVSSFDLRSRAISWRPSDVSPTNSRITLKSAGLTLSFALFLPERRAVLLLS